MKENNKSSNKSINEERRQAHKQQVEDIVAEVQGGGLEREVDFFSSKKLRWYDYIIIVIIYSIVMGISFILGIFALKDIIKTEYFSTAIGAVCVLVWLIMGFIRNNNSAKFYNDSRRRYQSTFTTEEGKNRRISKIFLLIGLILLITSGIFALTIRL